MAKTEFKQFDIVSDYSDHHYTTVRKQDHDRDGHSFMNGNSVVYKTIMREWRILKKNLPDGIYVRAYENRVDLMRAVIIGAPGTPYQDGLFFFDIMFPSNYPDHSPDVYYHSHGLPLNPILKSNGDVSFSLPNNTSWDPSRSTVLQVLVSIQALVLDEKPYYNDHKISIQCLHLLERISFPKVTAVYKIYNEEMFVLTCRLMVHLLENPPKNFESFIVQHFRKRASSILRSIADIDGPLQRISRKHLYPKLVQSFRKNGWMEEEELLEFKDQEKSLFDGFRSFIFAYCNFVFF